MPTENHNKETILHTDSEQDTIELAQRSGSKLMTTKKEASPQTRLRYQVVVRRLLNKHGNLENTLNWMSHSQRTIRRRTFSVYKAALKSVAAEEGWDVSVLDTISSNDFRKKMKDSSGHIMVKKIKTDDLLMLTSWLIGTDKRPQSPNPNTDLRWPVRAVFMLLATIHTGLRPVEWEHAELVDRPEDWPGPKGKWAIKCLNAKNMGRADSYRYIPISDDNKDQVQRHLELIDEWVSEQTLDMKDYKKEWAYYHNQCSRRLRQAYEALQHSGLKNITMYSGRHQFHANLIANQYHPDEIALLMGHTAVSSGGHYGKSRGGAFGPDDGFNPNNRPEV